jgi:hypothetical protein
VEDFNSSFVQLIRSCQIVLAVLNGDVSPAEAEVLKDDLELFNVSFVLSSGRQAV